MKKQMGGSGANKGKTNHLLSKLTAGMKLKLKNYEVNLARFNKFKQSKEEKIDLGEHLLQGKELIKTFTLSNYEKLIFYYMACLSNLKEREDNFNEILDEILDLCTNKLLIGNLLMLDLKIRMDAELETTN